MQASQKAELEQQQLWCDIDSKWQELVLLMQKRTFSALTKRVIEESVSKANQSGWVPMKYKFRNGE
ncbi:unnamed protein product [Sphenostylis stenocarpa]|uniref:Uncharacterized protein n=1 Tax=Sphenostylis stenocarpa TaxID=92480 RepID=A0AA86SE83_9FABA|nr:unnamed protein product [Sphenostylis stenocarpa]